MPGEAVGKSALFGQSRGEGKVLEMACSAIVNKEGGIRSSYIKYTKTYKKREQQEDNNREMAP